MTTRNDHVSETCRTCGGAGVHTRFRIPRVRECRRCAGTGRVSVPAVITVRTCPLQCGTCTGEDGVCFYEGDNPREWA